MIEEIKTLDTKQILEILPHRYPILLVDKIIKIDLENSFIIGQKNLTINEAFFQGHFPGAPIMPGVLMLEALAQTGAVLIHQMGYKDKTAALLSINNTKFRRPAKPGDILQMHCQGIHISGKGGRFQAKAFVEEGVVAVETEIAYVLVNKNQI